MPIIHFKDRQIKLNKKFIDSITITKNGKFYQSKSDLDKFINNLQELMEECKKQKYNKKNGKYFIVSKCVVCNKKKKNYSIIKTQYLMPVCSNCLDENQEFMFCKNVDLCEHYDKDLFLYCCEDNVDNEYFLGCLDCMKEFTDYAFNNNDGNGYNSECTIVYLLNGDSIYVNDNEEIKYYSK